MKREENNIWPMYFILLFVCLTVVVAMSVGNGWIKLGKNPDLVVHHYDAVEKLTVETSFVEITPVVDNQDLLDTVNTMVVRRK